MLLLSFAAHGQDKSTAALDSCLAIQDGDKRLKCYDKAAGFKPDEAQKKPDPGPVKWRVRDSNTVSPVGEADMGSKPGLVQAGRTDGVDFSTAKVAAFRVFQAINQPGGFWDAWQPFVGVSWDRDTSAKTPKDLRQAMAGIAGPDFTLWKGTEALPTLRLGYKDESKARQTGAFLNAHFEIVSDVLAKHDEGKDRNTPLLVPYLGLYGTTAHTDPTAATDGSTLSAYVGAKAGYKLDAIVDRLSLTGQGQWFHDLAAPGKTLRHRYATVGLQYDLADPDAKNGWVPSLSLSWQRGTEPVTGEGPGRKTVLGFGAKFN